ncbi:MAG: DUF3857 domain-containing protein [Pseudozobellia sp.]|nr:DUF3857 domain-containing protein [Pseudozobellia sp.]MBG47099.1 DUF3857 domain-containing protein [Pseudozobellia sp.]|tara:strand:- start:246 stop:2156 length:1911 start_codon:yes stop_codon:yes gene_type:complete
MRYLFLTISLFFSSYSYTQESPYTLEGLSDNLTKDANAIVRYDEMIVDINSRTDLTLKAKKIVTVLNESGNEFALAYTYYDNGRKIKNIEAFIYDSQGEQIERIKEKDFKDVSAVDGNTLYTDSRIKYYPYTPTGYPYTLEFSYELNTKNTGDIPSSWAFLDGFMVSTENSLLKINYANEDLRPVIKEFNLEDVDFQKEETVGSITYSAKNVPSIKRESYCPSFALLSPKIKIRPVNFHYEGYDASIRSWADLGVWMSQNLLSGRNELPLSTKNKINALVEGVEDDLEKAKIVYEYVQKNTRYISVQVGIGGMQPISAMDVDRVKYGDCKGLSNYTMALLREVGVEAYYAHVEAGNEQIDFDEDFPDLAQGNHAILAIPHNQNYYWIDCTSQTLPFGFIGDFTDNRKAFVIKPDGGEIVKTTSYIDEQNHQLTLGSYNLNSDGSIDGEVSILTSGIQYDDRFGLVDDTEDDIEKHYKNYWDNINNLRVNSYRFDNNKNEVKFTEEVSVNASNYAAKSGDRLLFAVNAFNKYKFVPNRYRNRKLPFEIQRGFFDEDEFTVGLPEGYGVESIPQPIQISTKYGSYELKVEDVEGQVVLKRKLLLKSGEYANTEYGAFRDFLKSVSKYDNSKVVLKPIL